MRFFRRNKRTAPKLDATLDHIKPRILVLDPLVRLHRLDENSAHEISGLLGFLRELQRRHQVAIVLSHHASKRKNARLGQSLRGSSDLHAFGDSNAYLSRKGEDIELSVEHRSASSMEPIRIKLHEDPNVYLKCINKNETTASASTSLEERIITILSKSESALRRSILREQLRVNNQRLGIELKKLCDSKTIELLPNGYKLFI
jgi:RecA-family ATPase